MAMTPAIYTAAALTPVIQMQHIHEQRASLDEVYVVLRVYELDSRKIGMRVYLDPEQLRLDEELSFTGETWSIVPQ